MKWERSPVYYPERIVYILFVVLLWFVPYAFSVPYWWHYIPLFFAFVPIAYEGIVQLFERTIGSEIFLIIATIIALIGGEETAIFVVLLIMLIAHYVDLIIKQRTEDALGSLIHLLPTDVLVKKGSEIVTVPLKSVKKDMQILVKTGGRIPVDGLILEGQATIQEAVLTGESVPLEKGPGELVYAGTYIEAGSCVVQVQQVGEETLFSKIKTLLDQAGKKKAPIVTLSHRITMIFTPTFLLFIGSVWLITGNTTMVITLLIFGSPLELTLVTPLTMLAARVAAFRKGILVKSGAALELLAATDTMIFDKTGTVTMGAPEVVYI